MSQSLRDNLWSGIPKLTTVCKVSRVQSKLKMLMSFAYDIQGILTTHKVPAGKTVIDEYYM